MTVSIIQSTIFSFIKMLQTKTKLELIIMEKMRYKMLDCQQAKDYSLVLIVHDCPGSLKVSIHDS